MFGANSETASHTHCISNWEPHKIWLCYKNHRLCLKKGFCFLKCILQCCQTDLTLSITLFWGNMIYATLALLQQSTYRRSSSPSTWTDLLKSTSPFILLLEMKRVLKNLGRSGSLPGERLRKSLAEDRAQMWVTLEGPQPVRWYSSSPSVYLSRGEDGNQSAKSQWITLQDTGCEVHVDMFHPPFWLRQPTI